MKRMTRTLAIGMAWLLTVSAGCRATPPPDIAEPPIPPRKNGHMVYDPASGRTYVFIRDDIPKQDHLKAPPGARTWAVPAGDPGARHLPDPIDQVSWPTIAPLNPKAQRKYRVHGRVPAHFQLTFINYYQAYRFDTPECQAELKRNLAYKDRSSEYAYGETTVQMPIRRSGERYEATLVIDRFVPTACQWVYQGTRAEITHQGKNQEAPAYGYVVDTEAYHLVEGANRCPRHAKKCTEERYNQTNNSAAMPVYFLCKTIPASETLGDRDIYDCRDTSVSRYKLTHALRPGTRAIEINFHDLDVEPSPLRANDSSSSTPQGVTP